MHARPPSTLGPTTEAAFRAILRTYGLVRRFNDPFFASYGISGPQWGVLRNLIRAEKESANGQPGQPLRLTDLCERLLVRPPSVTGVVDRLVRMGLVKRTASATDLRAKYVSLTARGRALVERMRAAHGARIEAILAVLSGDEQGQLAELLDKVNGHLFEMTMAEQPNEEGADQ